MKNFDFPYPGQKFWYINNYGELQEETFWIHPDITFLYTNSICANTDHTIVIQYKSFFDKLKEYKRLSKESLITEDADIITQLYGTDYSNYNSITGKVHLFTTQVEIYPIVIGTCWFSSDEDRIRALVKTKITRSWQKEYQNFLLKYGYFV